MDLDAGQPAHLDDLLEAAEPNPLLRRVDGMCATRQWDALVTFARRCREAYERGKQLWPIAEYIDYRLALEAPASFAAGVLTPTAGRFALGPLTEVAASTHTFDELAAFLPSPQVAGVVAGERVLRGEDLRGRPDAHGEVLELPLHLEPWEPAYLVPTYKHSDVAVPGPELSPLREEAQGCPAERLDEPDLVRALLEVVAMWVRGSGARADAVVVEGPACAAVAALGAEHFLLGRIPPAEALHLLGWAGASGGAHGRRRGAAAGRSAAWWAAAALCDLEWPPDPDELGDELSRLAWYRWEPPELTGGWNLHLAVEDAASGWAAALLAEDRAD